MGWIEYLTCRDQDTVADHFGHGEIQDMSPRSTSSKGRRTPRRSYRTPVFVHVYDLGQGYLSWGINAVAKSYGLFHSGVEVYGREWHFGETVSDAATGIAWNAPRGNRDHNFR